MKKIVIISFLACLISLTGSLAADTVWKTDFSSMDGWYDNNTDPSFNAVITAGTKAGTADVTQKGEGTWGKVAYVLENIDIDKNNIIKVNIADIEKGSAFKLLAISQDWSESFVVIDRGHGKGFAQGNIKDVTGWTGTKSFNLVVVIEGEKKKLTLNSIELLSKENVQNPVDAKPAVVTEKKKSDKK